MESVRWQSDWAGNPLLDSEEEAETYRRPAKPYLVKNPDSDAEESYNSEDIRMEVNALFEFSSDLHDTDPEVERVEPPSSSSPLSSSEQPPRTATAPAESVAANPASYDDDTSPSTTPGTISQWLTELKLNKLSQLLSSLQEFKDVYLKLNSLVTTYSMLELGAKDELSQTFLRRAASALGTDLPELRQEDANEAWSLLQRMQKEADYLYLVRPRPYHQPEQRPVQRGAEPEPQRNPPSKPSQPEPMDEAAAAANNAIPQPKAPPRQAEPEKMEETVDSPVSPHVEISEETSREDPEPTPEVVHIISSSPENKASANRREAAEAAPSSRKRPYRSSSGDTVKRKRVCPSPVPQPPPASKVEVGDDQCASTTSTTASTEETMPSSSSSSAPPVDVPQPSVEQERPATVGCISTIFCKFHGDTERPKINPKQTYKLLVDRACFMSCAECHRETEELRELAALKKWRMSALKGDGRCAWTAAYSCPSGHRFWLTLSTLRSKKKGQIKCGECAQESARKSAATRDFNKGQASMFAATRNLSAREPVSATSDERVVMSRLLSYERSRSPWAVFGLTPPIRKVKNKDPLYVEAKTRYRAWARLVHPDKNSNPKSKEAFLVLDQAWKAIEQSISG